MKHLMLLSFIIISCSQNTYEIELYSECDQCTVSFIYPGGETETFELVDKYAQADYSITEGTSMIQVSSVGSSYSEIRLFGEVVRSYQSKSDYQIEYSINRGGRNEVRQ